MNILFLTLIDFNSIDEKGIYTDLLRVFMENGHKLSVISPIEEKRNIETHLLKESNITILKLKIGNVKKTKNLLKKGISMLTLENKFIYGIKKYFDDVKFDFVLYSTPPITLCNAIRFVKERDNAKTYLLLKDIFPQNAVDLGMLSTKGVRGLIHRYFRNKEKNLYNLSDYIGCMSQANVDYILKNNSELDRNKVEVCPNSIEPVDMSCSVEKKFAIRAKYGIPLDKKVFVYGGNLGKPQGIDFLIDCLKACKDLDAYFLIVGDGTEYYKLEYFMQKEQQANVKLMKRLPKEDYDKMIGSCDVGMIFLDHRFTIPNFPSRLLSYMQAKLPVIVVADPITDMGSIAENNNFGWQCLSNDVNSFVVCVKNAMQINLDEKGMNAWQFLRKNYTADLAYKIIIKHFGDEL